MVVVVVLPVVVDLVLSGISFQKPSILQYIKDVQTSQVHVEFSCASKVQMLSRLVLTQLDRRLCTLQNFNNVNCFCCHVLRCSLIAVVE